MLTKIAAQFLFLTLSAPSNAALSDAFDDRAFLQAREALVEQNPSKALALLEPYAKQENSERLAEIRLLQGRASLETKQFKDTLKYLDGLEEALSSIRPTIWTMQAQAYRGLKDWPSLVSLWSEVLRRDPSNNLKSKAYLGLGDAFYGGGLLSEAALYYRKALGFKLPKQIRYVVQYNLARIAEASGRSADAVAGYKKLIYRNPHETFAKLARLAHNKMVERGSAAPLNFVAEMRWLDRLIWARKFSDARDLLVQLEGRLSSKQAKKEHRFFSGRLYLREGKPELALPIFSKLFAQAKNVDKRYLYTTWLARAYGAQERFDAAIQAYRDFTKRYPRAKQVREASYKAAWLAFNGKRYRQSIRLFQNFVARYKKGNDVQNGHWFIAWCAYRLDDFQLASKHLQETIAKPLSLAHGQRATYWMARIMEKRGLQEEAQQFYRKVVDMGPLTFYGAYAADARADLQAPELLLALNTKPERDENRLDIDRGLLRNLIPAKEDSTHLSLPKELPWQDDVLKWSTPKGKRVQSLMKLGLHKEASAEVIGLQGYRSASPASIIYAKARLLYSLGDFDGAYRLIGSTFREELKEGALMEEKEIFHLAYPDAYRNDIQEVAREFNLSTILLLSLIRQESAYDEEAFSIAGAYGLMQIISPTAERIAEIIGEEHFAVDRLNEPKTNMKFGAWYLRELLRKFHGNIALALASYNAGPRKVAEWLDWSSSLDVDAFIEEIPYRETRLYVKKIIRNLMVYSKLYRNENYEFQRRLPLDYLDNINF